MMKVDIEERGSVDFTKLSVGWRGRDEDDEWMENLTIHGVIAQTTSFLYSSIHVERLERRGSNLLTKWSSARASDTCVSSEAKTNISSWDSYYDYDKNVKEKNGKKSLHLHLKSPSCFYHRFLLRIQMILWINHSSFTHLAAPARTNGELRVSGNYSKSFFFFRLTTWSPFPQWYIIKCWNV